MRKLVLVFVLFSAALVSASKSRRAGFSIPPRCMQKIDLRKCAVKNAQTMICKETVVTYACIDAKPQPESGQVPKDRIEQEGTKGAPQQ